MSSTNSATSTVNIGSVNFNTTFNTNFHVNSNLNTPSTPVYDSPYNLKRSSELDIDNFLPQLNKIGSGLSDLKELNSCLSTLYNLTHLSSLSSLNNTQKKDYVTPTSTGTKLLRGSSCSTYSSTGHQLTTGSSTGPQLSTGASSESTGPFMHDFSQQTHKFLMRYNSEKDSVDCTCSCQDSSSTGANETLSDFLITKTLPVVSTQQANETTTTNNVTVENETENSDE